MFGVVLITEDKSGINADVVFPEIRESLFVAPLHGVEALLHGAEISLVQTFEPDQCPFASALFEQSQELLIVGGIDAHLGDPADIQGREFSEQDLCGLDVARKIVVYKK